MVWREDDQRRWQERKKERGIVPKQRPIKPAIQPPPKRAQASGLGDSLTRLRNKNQTAADWPGIPLARFYFSKPVHR